MGLLTGVLAAPDLNLRVNAITAGLGWLEIKCVSSFPLCNLHRVRIRVSLSKISTAISISKR